MMYVVILSFFVVLYLFYVYDLFNLWFWVVIFFFFKQKTAYEMRMCDWISDVCSSDLFASAMRTPSTIAPMGSLKASAMFAWLMVISFGRSEERRVGKECVRTCRSRWSQYP